MRFSQTDCPFDEGQVDNYSAGNYAALAISFVLTAYVWGLCYVTWKLSWNKHILPLNYQSVLSIADCVIYLTLVIEVLQNLALAPGMYEFNDGLDKFLAAFLVDIFELKTMEDNDYGIKLVFFLVASGLWVTASFWLLFRLRKSGVDLSASERVAVHLSYFVTHVATLPILAAYVESYVCNVDYDNTIYLRQDCSKECWKSTQVAYFVLSLLALVLHNFQATLQTPLWQEHASNIHIKVQPASALLRFAVQFFLLSFNRALESGQMLAYAIIYTLTFLVWLVISFRNKPYNYTRISMWCISGQVVCLWAGILLVLVQFGARGPWLNVLLGLGWGFVIGFTIHRQHYHLPSLLSLPSFTLLAKKPRTDESKDSMVALEEDDLLSQRPRRKPVVLAEEVGEVLCPANSRVHTVT